MHQEDNTDMFGAVEQQNIQECVAEATHLLDEMRDRRNTMQDMCMCGRGAERSANEHVHA